MSTLDNREAAEQAAAPDAPRTLAFWRAALENGVHTKAVEGAPVTREPLGRLMCQAN